LPPLAPSRASPFQTDSAVNTKSLCDGHVYVRRSKVSVLSKWKNRSDWFFRREVSFNSSYTGLRKFGVSLELCPKPRKNNFFSTSRYRCRRCQFRSINDRHQFITLSVHVILCTSNGPDAAGPSVAAELRLCPLYSDILRPIHTARPYATVSSCPVGRCELAALSTLTLQYKVYMVNRGNIRRASALGLAVQHL